MKPSPLAFWASRFDDAKVFVRCLGAGEDGAVEYLFQKTIRRVEGMAREAGLPRQEAEEVLNDMAVVFIQKIREEKFQLTEAPPHTYALGIAHWLVKNRAARERNRRISPVELETVALFRPDEGAGDHFTQKENADFVHSLLGQLSEKCRLLIRLRYFEGWADEEAVGQGMTPYSTVDSLKNRRKECLAKLRDLVKGRGFNDER